MNRDESTCHSEANTSTISMVRAHEKCDEFDDNANEQKVRWVAKAFSQPVCAGNEWWFGIQLQLSKLIGDT